jgi:hypothetical protein
MKRISVTILTLLSLSSAALAQGWSNTDPVSQQDIARADRVSMHHDPSSHYVRNANDCGMELSRAVWGPNEVLLGYACYSNSN